MIPSIKQRASDVLSDRLPPCLPAGTLRARTRVTAFGGLCADPTVSWGIARMKNLSPRLQPALSTRPPRDLLAWGAGNSTPHGMAMLGDDLYYVQGTTLFRIADALGGTLPHALAETVAVVSDTDKCMAVFGDHLLIFPDKLYVHTADGVARPMEIETAEAALMEFQGNRLTLPAGMTWTGLGFFAGDSVFIQNADAVTPAPEGYYRIREIHGREAYMQTAFPSYDSCHALLKRVIPDMEGVAVCGDRIYGFAGKQVYIGAEGSPFAFWGYQSDGGGAAVLHSHTQGDFTACIPWQGYVFLFKDREICRVMGTRADSFALTETPASGIPRGMARTLCEVEGNLYYHGENGVYRLRGVGHMPERLPSLGGALPIEGRGGTDGVAYCVALAHKGAEGTLVWRRYLYMPQTGAWYAEDDRPVAAYRTLGGFLCTQDGEGRIWLSRSDGYRAGAVTDERDLEGAMHASVTFHPDYTHEPDGYRPMAVCLRASGEEGGEMRVLASFADGRFGRDASDPVPSEAESGDHTCHIPDGAVELARFAGGMRDRLLRIPLALPHCDHMILSFEMVGDWSIGALMTEYEVTHR